MLRQSPAEIVLHQHRHHAVVLPELIYYFAHLAGSRRRGRHRVERVLNAEVLSVQHLVIGDSNHVEYDYIITLQASARDLQVVFRCISPITRCLDELIDGSW